MKHPHFLLALISSFSSFAKCTDTAMVIAGQKPFNTAITSLPMHLQARQDTAASPSTSTSGLALSITTLPSPSPSPIATSTFSDDELDEPASSTLTITITRSRTITIRPTVTVMAPMALAASPTSGATRASESLVLCRIIKCTIWSLMLLFLS
ncbi:hypothetical protein F4808DRAFT_424894 [Astrocystis sublimbata]|nr:hypothetical protein F4808DRAFT_424894 [Astrocystis sublimbata]